MPQETAAPRQARISEYEKAFAGMTPERQKEVKAQIRARFATCMAGFKIRSEERRRSLILDHHALNMRFTK